VGDDLAIGARSEPGVTSLPTVPVDRTQPLHASTANPAIKLRKIVRRVLISQFSPCGLP
jgi:hypothetical protein